VVVVRCFQCSDFPIHLSLPVLHRVYLELVCRPVLVQGAPLPQDYIL
jgi:hypothetical protein